MPLGELASPPVPPLEGIPDTRAALPAMSPQDGAAKTEEALHSVREVPDAVIRHESLLSKPARVGCVFEALNYVYPIVFH